MDKSQSESKKVNASAQLALTAPIKEENMMLAIPDGTSKGD